MSTVPNGNENLNLRQRAELQAKAAQESRHEPMSHAEALRMLYELEVHQIEQEMQHEELRQAQRELEQRELEHRVAVRTQELQQTNELLRKEITERKQAEAALSESEQRHRSLLNEMLDGYAYCRIVFDDKSHPVDLIYLNVNSAFEQLTGLRNVVGRAVTEVIPGHKETNPELFEMYGRVVLTGKPEKLEIYIKSLTRWLSISVTQAGEGCFVAIFNDITERKQAEDSFRLHAAIFANLVDGVHLVDVHGIICYTNSPMEKLLGYEPGELAGRSVAVINAPTDRSPDDIKQEIMLTLLQQGEWHGEIENLRKDGSRLWCYASVSTFDHPTFGRVFLSFHTDITERKLQEVERQTILRTTIDGFYLVDVAGRILETNEAYCSMIGYSREELLKMAIKDFEVIDTDEVIKARIQKIRKIGHARFETQHRRKDGRIIDIDASCNFLGGEQKKLFVFMRDITERKRIEAEQKILEKQNRQLHKTESLGRMAGAIAHHFNNKLAAVLLNLNQIEYGLPQSGEPAEALAEALQAAREAATVSTQMLTYLGQSLGHCAPLDLSELCGHHLVMLRAALPTSVIWETDFASPGPVIKANADRIQQLLTNLVTNACEAMAENNETIRLAIRTVAAADIPVMHRFPLDWQPQAPSYACLEVSDSGCGIAPGDLDKLFDPFFSTKFTGRGLGLPVVLGILRTHQGVATVESRLGQGSVFRVFLPVSEQAVLQKPVQVNSASHFAQGGTVLVVEDDYSLRRVVARGLTQLGFTVLTAANGFEAVEIFREKPDQIRLVLCDLTMPRMNGWETMATLRKLAPNVLVILSSGFNEAQAMAGQHPELPQAFLGKPYQFEDLRDTVARVLEKAEQDKNL